MFKGDGIRFEYKYIRIFSFNKIYNKFIIMEYSIIFEKSIFGRSINKYFIICFSVIKVIVIMNNMF